MFCKNCGTKNDEGSRFCMECGMPLEQAALVREEQTEERTQAVSAEQNVQYQAPAQPQPKTQSAATPVSAPEESYMSRLMKYELPDDTILKLPFAANILKFIRIGIWTLLFISVFLCWYFVETEFFGVGSREKSSLLTLVFGGGEAGIMTFVGILTLLTILAATGIQAFNTFSAQKLKIPEFLLCAAPAAITFIYMVIAWIVSLVIIAEYREFGMSAGPGFGAWLALLLSGIETAAYVLFIKDKKQPLIKF